MDGPSFLGGLLKNPFEDKPEPAPSSSFYNAKIEFDAPFDPAPEGLITRAKIFLASDMGVLDGGSLLDEDFIWIGATSNGNVLGKSEYLAAAKFFDLRYVFDMLYSMHLDYARTLRTISVHILLPLNLVEDLVVIFRSHIHMTCFQRYLYLSFNYSNLCVQQNGLS